MADFFTGPTGRTRLLRTFEHTDTAHTEDLIYCCAVMVEDAMLQGGCVPRIDYDRAKLFELAMPLALAAIGNDSVILTTGIPDSHPHAGLPTTTKSQADRAEIEVLNYLSTHGASHANKIVNHVGRPVLTQLRSLITKGLVGKTPNARSAPTYYITDAGCEYIVAFQ